VRESVVNLRRMALLWAVGRVSAEDVVDAAVRVLADQVDSPTLVLLAGVHHREAVQEVPELLPRVLHELAIPIPPRDTYELKVEAGKELARMFLEGHLAPKEAAAAIYQLFVPSYPDAVYPFLLLHDEYSIIGQHTRRSEAEIDAAVAEAAREFVSEVHDASGATHEEMWARWRPTG
jgi:hypothetical protein